MTNFTGTAGDDNYTGSYTYDYFDLSQGGNDTARGSAGSDSFSLGGALTVADRIDGGAGADYIYLQGDYSAGLTLTAGAVVNIEAFYLNAGFDYDLTFADATNSTSGGMTVSGSNLLAGDTFHFDGSRETRSSYYLYGGAGDDRLTSGGGNDNFYLSYGGHDVLSGGDGQDSFSFYATFDVDDRVNGGNGHDYMYLEGDYNLVLKAGSIRFVEQIYLSGDHDFKVRLNDGTVAAGESLYISANQVSGAHRATIDGSRELDGKLTLSGGQTRDVLTGGANDDQIFGNAGGDSLFGGDGDDLLLGGAGHDEMTGGAGVDTFYFDEGDAPAANPDLILDLALTDAVDIAAVDANTTLANDQAFILVTHFHNVAGELDLEYDSGAGVTHFRMDTDGDGLADQAFDATGNRTAFVQFVY